MDVLGFCTLPGWLVTILLFVLTLVLYSVYCLTYFWRLGIPGPRPSLFLGSLTSLMKKGVYVTDLEFSQKYGTFYGVYAGHLPCVMVSDVDVIKQICIKDFSKFPNRVLSGMDNDPVVKGGMSLARDDHWKFIRTVISPTFSSGKMRQMTPLLQRCIDDLINKLIKDTENGDSIDVCTYCGSFSMDVIASTAFGMNVDAQNGSDNAFVKHAKAALQGGLTNPFIMLTIFFPFTRKVLPYLNLSSFPKKIASFFTTAVSSVIKDRKSETTVRPDLLGLMLNAHKDIETEEVKVKLNNTNRMDFVKRPLTDQEILANALVFLLAGYETTANVLSFVLYCMALYPEYADRLRSEVDEEVGQVKPSFDNVTKLQYLDMFLSEVLRLYGSAIRFTRIAEEDVVINEYQIHKDMDIQFPITVIHRDPALWPNPEVFDPERFTPENKAKRHPYAWVPFGVGPRNCVGMRFALTELKMAAVAILQNFIALRCEDTEVPITFHKGWFMRAANGIKLKLQRR